MWTQISRVVMAIVLSLSVVGVASAQRTSATFAGIVTDTDRGVLPGALVELTNEGTGAVTTQTTDAQGEFLFNFVPVGTYTLSISLSGFTSYRAESIQIGAAQNVRRTYELNVAGIEETVTVTGEAIMINTVSPEQVRQTQLAEIESVPLFNRSISGILDVTSGVTTQESNEGSDGKRLRLSGLGGSSLRIAADGTDASGNAGSPSLSNYQGFNKIDVMGLEAVAESQIVKGVFSAEYGMAMSGFLNVISKSGTNDFHGSAVYRYDTSSLTADDPFLGEAPDSTWHQFGGSLGGPLVRNRAFFFVAFEGYRQNTFDFHNVDVPTPLLRQRMLETLPFDETQILLDQYPLPTEPFDPGSFTGTFIGSDEKIANDDHLNAKVNVAVGKGDLSTIVTLAHPYLDTPRSLPGNSREYDSTTTRVGANYVTAWSNWVSETRFGYNKNELFRVDSFWNAKDPNQEEVLPAGRRIAQANIPGIPDLSRENQTRGQYPTYSLEQQFALVTGEHALKFGGIWFRPGGSRPGSESPNVTFPTYDELFANDPSQIGIKFPLNPFRWWAHNFGFFVQDDWRVSSKLVVNLGLRWDYYGGYHAEGVEAQFPAGLYNLDRIDEDRHHDENFNFGPLRDPANPTDANPINLGPRVGFSYNPDDEGKMVFRGGIGLMTQPIDQQIYENQTGNVPNVPNRMNLSRAEAQALGFAWPTYDEDVFNVVSEMNQDEVFVGGLFDPGMGAPRALNATFNVQRQLSRSTVLESGFVHTRGYNFQMSRTYNQVDRVTGERPNPDLTEGQYWDGAQRTTYYGWETSLNYRFSRGLVNVSYTLGRAYAHSGGDISPGFIGDTTNNVQDFFDPEAEWGPASGDVRHNFVGSWAYRVPTDYGYLKGGWEVSGIFRVRSGEPFDVTQSSSVTSRPDLVDPDNAINPDCCDVESGNLQYLNPDAFELLPRTAASGATIRPGTYPHNALRGPGFFVIDLAVGKSTRLGGGVELDFRADILNVLDVTNYGGLRTNLSASRFGVVTATASRPRTIQLQARMTF